MAILTRTYGSASGVANVDIGLSTDTSTGIPISFISKKPIFLKVTGGSTFANDLASGYAVEALLRTICQSATILAYQVDAAQVSILLEASGWANDAAIQTAVQAIPTSASASSYNFSSTTVASTNGFKLA